MQKAYNMLNWENKPSIKTPINEKNLNDLSKGVDEIDNRVIALDANKATKTEVSTLIADIAWNESTGVITFTRKNGATLTLDTKLEKLAVNFAYDQENERLVITLDDGTKQYVDMSALITQYEFLESDTIAFVLENGKVRAVLKEGSVEEKHLRPDYLADIKVETAASGANASAAESSATKSQSYAVGGTGTRENEDVDNSRYYYQQAKQISQGLNGLVPMGTISFSQLPTSGIVKNAMYNISEDFTSDSRFVDGGGISYGKGSNVYYTSDGLWDVLAASDVKGIRGAKEDSFRQGNVTLAPEDLGAASADDTLMYKGSIFDLKLEDIATAPIGVYGFGNSTDTVYGIPKYSTIYKASQPNFNGSFLICRQTGATQDKLYVYRTSQGKFRAVPYAADLANYLPLTGGALSDNLSIEKESGSAEFFAKNAVATLGVRANADGTCDLYDAVHNKILVLSDANGNVYLDGVANILGSINKANSMSVREHTGTPTNAEGMFVQAEYDAGYVTVGINGMGGVGVNRAHRAYADINGKVIHETYAVKPTTLIGTTNRSYRDSNNIPVSEVIDWRRESSTDNNMMTMYGQTTSTVTMSITNESNGMYYSEITYPIMEFTSGCIISASAQTYGSTVMTTATITECTLTDITVRVWSNQSVTTSVGLYFTIGWASA